MEHQTARTLEEEMQKLQEEKQTFEEERRKFEEEKRKFEEVKLAMSDVQTEACSLSLPSIASSSECYPKRKGTTGGIQGHRYECRFAALCALNGLDRSEFYLGNNVSKCGAFDDIVFSSKDVNGMVTYFIQLKHFENDDEKVTFAYLTHHTKGLPKYCHSFANIKKQFSPCNNQIFRENFDTTCFVLYTNAALHYPSDCKCRTGQSSDTCESTLEPSRNHFLSTNPNGHVYIFDGNPCLYNDMMSKHKGLEEEQQEVPAVTPEQLQGLSKKAKKRVLKQQYKREKEKEQREEGQSNMKENYYAGWQESDLCNFLKKFKLFTSQQSQENLKPLILKKFGTLMGNSDERMNRLMCDSFLEDVADWHCKKGETGYITHKSIQDYITEWRNWTVSRLQIPPTVKTVRYTT